MASITFEMLVKLSKQSKYQKLFIALIARYQVRSILYYWQRNQPYVNDLQIDLRFAAKNDRTNILRNSIVQIREFILRVYRFFVRIFAVCVNINKYIVQKCNFYYYCECTFGFIFYYISYNIRLHYVVHSTNTITINWYLIATCNIYIVKTDMILLDPGMVALVSSFNVKVRDVCGGNQFI